MISSIVLKDRYNINLNSKNRIIVEGVELSYADVPFVRYRFDKYSKEDLEYISKVKNKFNKSTHLVEITVKDDDVSILEFLEALPSGVAKYLYVDLTDEDVSNCAIRSEISSILCRAVSYDIDRIMIRDRSTTLDMVTFKEIVKSLMRLTRLSEDKFGVCSSPLSFSDLACLTAVKARELMSKYSDTTDVALPSSNHQCMNCCGCIRYIVATKDIIAAPEKDTVKREKKAKKTGSDSDSNKGSNEKKSTKGSTKNKAALQPGMFRL